MKNRIYRGTVFCLLFYIFQYSSCIHTNSTESHSESMEPPKWVDTFVNDSPHLILDSGTGKSTFTFASPSSFIQIGSQEVSRYQIRNRRSVSLDFRTRLPHALLVYHGIKNRPSSMLKYELYVMLDQGQLKIIHLFGDYSTILEVGKGLNRDNWHKVKVTIDPSDEIISVVVDDMEQSMIIDGLDEHHLYGADNDDLESIIFVGGMVAEDEAVDISYLANPFVGCIRNVVLETSPLKTVALEPIVPLVSTSYRNVDETCLNKCWEPTVKCSRDSRCINHYDHVECDCFAAKFKGEKCKDTGKSKLTLSGYSYVTFTVYEWMDRVHSDTSRVSMDFKTFTDDSILMYAAGESPYHNHIGASIYNRTVNVDVDFGNGNPISVNFRRIVTDGKWHTLTVLHQEKNITVKLTSKGAGTLLETFTLTGPHHHLYIDPDIYVGGGGPILKSREGLKSSNNFVGCLSEVYFNEKSIVYELHKTSHQARHHGLTAPLIGEQCQDEETVPITIPFQESGFRLLNPKYTDGELHLKFSFTTQKPSGTLAYSEIRTIKGEGFWELKFTPEDVVLEVQYDKFIAEITPAKKIAVKLANKIKMSGSHSWHHVELKYSNGQFQLKVGDQTAFENAALLQMWPSIIMGTSLYRRQTGFVGCMRRVEIGGKYVDARRVVGSDEQIGDIALDNCRFINPCNRPDVCEHDGICMVENGEVLCDCTKTGYIGKHCHFAIFKRTCEELALLGYTESGVYKIDIDGNGPFKPSHVKCKFETDASGETKTIVEHNLKNETHVWQPYDSNKEEDDRYDFKMDLVYREFIPEMLLSLASQSVQCSQHIKFECYKAKLGLHQYTFFQPADPQASRVVSIGDAKRSTCPCFEAGTCVNGEHCNCDSLADKWLSDEGYFTFPDRLGITQLNFVKPKSLVPKSEARITLGPLECVEANTQRYVVTFKTFGSFLEAPGWKSGDLAFSFRTTRSSAILLYQPLLHQQHNAFSVYLTNDHELTFRFILNGGQPQKVTVRSKRPLSGGDWQQVWIDYDLHQVRFQINREHQMINLQDGEQFGPFEGTMYIAGAPVQHLSDAEVDDGLIGCFRGLVMNGQVIDLYSYMKFHKADIVKDCSPSCDPNPCKNSAVCQENWGSFTCQCKNPWAHSGTLCETDINIDGLTFLSQSSFIMKQSSDNNPEPLKTILTGDLFLNLRTYDSSALVLYANDNLNNFVQVLVEGGTTVAFTWNDERVIRRLAVSHKRLNHGYSIQIAIRRNATHTTLYVGENNSTFPVGVHLLTKYSEKPWSNPQLEIFTPPRPFAPVSSYYQLLLGGFDNHALKPVSNATNIPGMLGCLRGLKIGSETFRISGMANHNDVLQGCEMVCDSKPCQNGGLCLEDFQARTYSCDCTYTSYYGSKCIEERGADFQGESYIRRRFKNPETRVKNVEVRFGFSATYSDADTVLLTVQIPGQLYSLLFAINKEGHLMLREHQGNQNITDGALIKYQNFVDGSRHSIYFQRTPDETIFIVDQEQVSMSSYEPTNIGPLPSVILGQDLNIGEVFTGGVNDVSHLRGFRRFKGCMSNIYVEVSGVRMRPVDEYMGSAKKDPDVVLDVDKMDGIKFGGCAAFSLLRSKLMVSPTNDLTPPISEGEDDWLTGAPSKVTLNIRKASIIESSAISFSTMALIFGIFLGVLLIALIMYTYRLNKRYKRRILEDDDDDDLYYNRGPQIHYQDPPQSDLKYLGYKRNDPDRVELLKNHHVPTSAQSNEIRPQMPSSTDASSTTQNKDDDKDRHSSKIDEDNASSDTTSENGSEESHKSSASSLSNTQILDDKGVEAGDLAGDNMKQLKCSVIDEILDVEEREDQDRRMGQDDDTDTDNDSIKFRFPSVHPNAIPSPVYVSDSVRTFESSPLAKIAGAKYQQMKRTSKDSLLSLD